MSEKKIEIIQDIMDATISHGEDGTSCYLIDEIIAEKIYKKLWIKGWIK